MLPVSTSLIVTFYGHASGSDEVCFCETIYTSPIADIASCCGLNIHLSADDAQIYIAFETSSSTDEQVAIETI